MQLSKSDTLQNNESDEKWGLIPFLDNKFEVSTLGRIRNKLTGEVRATPVSKRGYPVFSARVNNKLKLVNVHKCVATVFIPNPDNLPQVNHIDGNKQNNCVDNLEWCTARENVIHARLTGLHKSDGDKPVLQIKDGVIINEYKSASEASKITGIARANICNVCNKRIWKGHHFYTAGGFKWVWKKSMIM